MSSSVPETLSPIHQTNKLHPRKETTIDRYHGNARLSPPATLKTSLNNGIEGEDDPGSCSDSGIGDSNPVIPARGDATQSNVGRRAHHSVTTLNRSDEDIAGISGIILPQDSTRTRSYIGGSASASVRSRGEAWALPTVDQRRRSSSRHSSTGGLDVMDSDGRVIGGNEPPFRQSGCLTTAAFLKLVTILAALGNVGLVLLQYDFAAGRLCLNGEEEPCLYDPVSNALLMTSKLCAGALIPSIAICVLSKCYATRYFVNNSWLALVIDFEPTHKLHTDYGVVILLCSVIHGMAHLARVAYESNMELLHGEVMNRSGIAALVLLLPTALPMMVGYLKTKLTFELRKLMHLAFIPFTIAICFHGETMLHLGIILLTWYLVDRFFFTTKMCFFISRPNLKTVGRGTFVRFYLPEGYHFKPGAYVQVNCPAISALEWHPFSLFPVPGKQLRAGFHVDAVGDWTKELFRLGLKSQHVPLWITAAQPSVLERTTYYENVILVCTGAGITPAICVIERLAKKKNVHLLWLSREAGMIAMFEKQVRRVRSTVHLTGKPSARTKQNIIGLLAPARSEVVAAIASTSCAPSSPPSKAPASDTAPGELEAGARRMVVSLRDYPGALRGEGKDEDGDEKLRCSSEEEKLAKDITVGSSGRQGLRYVLGKGGSPKARRKSLTNYDEGDNYSDDDEEMHKGDSHRNNSHRIRMRRNYSGRTDRRSRSHSHSSSSYGSRSGDDSSFKRHRDLFPVSVCFGRPDIKRYITETVEGTAITMEWADTKGDTATIEKLPPPSRLRRALERLNTNQRISKNDLMSADLSVVKSKSTKSPSRAKSSRVGPSASPARSSRERPCSDSSTWLVIYCGSNEGVEKAVENACGKLKVAWRKEYFSAW